VYDCFKIGIKVREHFGLAFEQRKVTVVLVATNGRQLSSWFLLLRCSFSAAAAIDAVALAEEVVVADDIAVAVGIAVEV